jgi:hypothetical protein
MDTELMLNASRFNVVYPRQHGRQSSRGISTHLISRLLPKFLLSNSFSFPFSVFHSCSFWLPVPAGFILLCSLVKPHTCTEIVRCHFHLCQAVFRGISTLYAGSSKQGVWSCVHGRADPSVGEVWNLDRAPSSSCTVQWGSHGRVGHRGPCRISGTFGLAIAKRSRLLSIAPAQPRRRMWATRRMASNKIYTSPALSFELVGRCSVSHPVTSSPGATGQSS